MIEYHLRKPIPNCVSKEIFQL